MSTSTSGAARLRLTAVIALVVLPLGNTALAECRAPAACIACHAAIGHPTPDVLTALGPATCAVGDFTRGLNMTLPRFIHRTAKLTDGRVLLTGGETVNVPAVVITNSVDIFNPADNSVAPGSPMTVRRWSHTATTLLDGRVLVVGGRTGSSTANGQVLNTAEIFDPLTGAWTETAGHLNVARRSHSATLLSNGRVLIAGGGDNPSTTAQLPIASAEIFDPATGLFTLIGNMTVARSSHSAILLPDHTVLITGGSTGASTLFPTNLAEVFNPANNSFMPVGPMIFSHLAQNPAQLRDGRVLQPSAYSNPTHTASGGIISADSEIYNPVTRLFTAVAPMFKKRIDIGGQPLLDGTILVTGGVTTSPSFPSIFQSSSEVYNATANQWKLSGIMSIGRDEFSGAALNDGRVMISGGFVSPGAVLLNSVEVYSPGLIPQVNGLFNVMRDLPDSALRYGGLSRIVLDLGVFAIQDALGVPKASHLNYTTARQRTQLVRAVIPTQIKPSSGQIARVQSVLDVLIRNLDDKITPNLVPTVAPAAAPSSGVEQLAVNFTGNAVDPDGTIAYTLWRFGDGETSNLANPPHLYQCKGNYNATLEVVDNRGAVGAGAVPVTVTSAGGPVTYRCDVQPVFNRTCTGCHGASAGLNLATCNNLQAGETTGPVIVPGSKESSILWDEINTGGMPAVGGRLPQADIDAIGAWIDSLNPADTNFCD